MVKRTREKPILKRLVTPIDRHAEMHRMKVMDGVPRSAIQIRTYSAWERVRHMLRRNVHEGTTHTQELLDREKILKLRKEAGK